MPAELILAAHEEPNVKPEAEVEAESSSCDGMTNAELVRLTRPEPQARKGSVAEGASLPSVGANAKPLNKITYADLVQTEAFQVRQASIRVFRSCIAAIARQP